MLMEKVISQLKHFSRAYANEPKRIFILQIMIIMSFISFSLPLSLVSSCDNEIHNIIYPCYFFVVRNLFPHSWGLSHNIFCSLLFLHELIIDVDSFSPTFLANNTNNGQAWMKRILYALSYSLKCAAKGIFTCYFSAIAAVIVGNVQRAEEENIVKCY